MLDGNKTVEIYLFHQQLIAQFLYFGTVRPNVLVLFSVTFLAQFSALYFTLESGRAIQTKHCLGFCAKHPDNTKCIRPETAVMSKHGLKIQQKQENGVINKKRLFKHGIALSTKVHATVASE